MPAAMRVRTARSRGVRPPMLERAFDLPLVMPLSRSERPAASTTPTSGPERPPERGDREPRGRADPPIPGARGRVSAIGPKDSGLAGGRSNAPVQSLSNGPNECMVVSMVGTDQPTAHSPGERVPWRRADYSREELARALEAGR